MLHLGLFRKTTPVCPYKDIPAPRSFPITVACTATGVEYRSRILKLNIGVEYQNRILESNKLTIFIGFFSFFSPLFLNFSIVFFVVVFPVVMYLLFIYFIVFLVVFLLLSLLLLEISKLEMTGSLSKTEVALVGTNIVDSSDCLSGCLHFFLTVCLSLCFAVEIPHQIDKSIFVSEKWWQSWFDRAKKKRV